MSNQQKPPNLYFTSLAPKDKKNYRVGHPSLKLRTNKIGKFNVRNKSKTSWAGAKKNFWYGHWKLSPPPHAFFPKTSWALPTLVHIETSFTMRAATGITLQRHQILRLARKMTLIIRHIWNVIYTMQGNRIHPPPSPNITMRGATGVTLRRHQILPLARKMTAQNLIGMCWKQLKRHVKCAADPNMIREWPDHETVSS